VNIRSTTPINLLIAVLCVNLSTTAQGGGNRPARSNSSNGSSDQDHPRRVKPPRTPREQGFRIVITAGLNGFAAASYGYTTRITMPNGQQLHYSGTQRTSGGTLSGGFEITPPGALRRFTAGVSVNGGGLESWALPVTPPNAVTPFSRANLQFAIESTGWNASGWHPAFSPYLEHELGNLLGNRMRLGYQYWNQAGNYKGSFVPTARSATLAEYDVRLNYSAHLVRVSLNNFTNLDDSDVNFPGSHRSKRRYGLVQQIGILVGTHQTVMIFIGVGPFWSF
jgi:hypothetical protein